jgi:CubicO group peptidase (beta-lactamase class C family)
MERALGKRISTAVFALLAFGLVAAAPPSLPDTPAGRRFSAWLTAFNSGSRDTFKQYLEKYNPKTINSLDDQMAFRAMTGGFDVRKIEKSTPTQITVLMQEHLSDQFAVATLKLQGKPPYQLAGGTLDAVPRPPEFAIPHLAQPQLIAALEPRLQEQSAAGEFSGTVLVAKDGAPVFERAYGFADRATHTPNTLETSFRIGSMNKMFTATAVMQLVQDGKIDLDKPFGTYITDYPNKDVSSAVTIRQLLTHTGGTGDIFGPKFDKNRLKLRTLQDYIDLYGKRPLLFKPGAKFDYSNYGFVLLGAVVEKVSGQSYYDYVREHIYEPAGMTSTGSEPENANVPNRSIGYTLSPKGSWIPNTDTLPYRGTSAGGGYSSAGDLLRFANALLAHKLLNAQYTEMMTTGKVAMGPGGMKYGFGFGDGVLNGTRCFGHNGGAPGMNGDLEICAGAGYTVVVLSNLDPPAAGRISNFIVNRLPEK